MTTRAGDVDKILIPFDRVSSFSQSRCGVKVPGVNSKNCQDKHGFSQTRKNISAALTSLVLHSFESAFICGRFFFNHLIQDQLKLVL
jgi:hypothetical protein